MSHPLQHLYDQVPKLDCIGKCGNPSGDHCCGPIGCTVTEAKLMEEHIGREVNWISVGPGAVLMDPEHLPVTLTCPFLSFGGRCDVYEVRPLICRIWGTIKALQCPYGCKPKKWLSDLESRKLLAEARKAA